MARLFRCEGMKIALQVIHVGLHPVQESKSLFGDPDFDCPFIVAGTRTGNQAFDSKPFHNPGGIRHLVQHPVLDQVDCRMTWVLTAKNPEHVVLLPGNVEILEDPTHHIDEIIVGVKNIDDGLLIFAPEIPLLNIFAD